MPEPVCTVAPHAPPPPEPQWYDRLGLLLESTGEGIFGIDLDGLCVFINRAGAGLLGFEPGEVLGQNMHELTHHSHGDGRHYPVEACPIFNAFRQGLPCRIDSEVFWHRDGSTLPVEYSSYPILDGTRVLGAVITFVDITERRRAAQALQRAKDELELRVRERTLELQNALQQTRELAAYSETVREEERTRIAREVHDELGSLLVALKMDVNWLDKRLSEQSKREPAEAEEVRERLRHKCQHMSRQIESAVDNVGRIITDLRPSILDHQGLWAALEWQAQEFVRSAELSLSLHMAVNEQLELPEPAAMAVFRMFQEMLSNVGRHAQASALNIRIEHILGENISSDDLEPQLRPQLGPLLRITVQDNGVGARPEAFEAAQAYGVMGMRERARHLGGSLSISSEPGQGCQVVMELPLPVQARP